LEFGLSQNGMLERLGFSEELFRSNVSHCERGARVPPLPVLLEYARAAGVYVDDLIDDEFDLPEKIPGTKKTHHEGTKAQRKSQGFNFVPLCLRGEFS
jgi:transcriptional regulator with XRE-family HTH domain